MKLLFIISFYFSSFAFAESRLGCDTLARTSAMEALEREGFGLTGHMQTVVVDSTWGDTKYTSMQPAYIYTHADHRRAYATCHGLIRHPVKEALYSAEAKYRYQGYSRNGYAKVKAIPTLDTFETLLVSFDVYFSNVTAANYLGGFRDQMMKPVTELPINAQGYFSQLDFIHFNLPESGMGYVIAGQTLQVSSDPYCENFEPVKLPFTEQKSMGRGELFYSGISIEYALHKCQQDAKDNLISLSETTAKSCVAAKGSVYLRELENRWSDDTRKKTFFCTAEQTVICGQPSLSDRMRESCRFQNIDKLPPVVREPIRVFNTTANAGIRLSTGEKICVDKYPSPIVLVNNSDFSIRYKLADAQGSLKTNGDSVSLSFIVPSTLILSPYDGSELRAELVMCN